MPSLFCLALKPELEAIRAQLPPGACVVPHLDDIGVVCDATDAYEIFCYTRDTLREACHIDANIGRLATWSENLLPTPPDLHLLGQGVGRGTFQIKSVG